MAKKTNKTSHVMNLLTNGTSAENGDPADTITDASSPESSAAGGEEKKGDASSHTAGPTKVTVVDEASQNDRLSQEIFNKLSEELEEEIKDAPETAPKAEPAQEPVSEAEPASAAEPAPASEPETASTPVSAPESDPISESAPEPQPAPVSESAPEPSSAPVSEPAPASQSAPVSEPAPEPSSASVSEPAPASSAPVSESAPEQTSAPASESVPQAKEPEANPAPEQPVQLTGKTAHHAFLASGNENLISGEFRFINVMEHLMLRQDISSYLDQYNVCKCPRCMADVCALALTGLPPKYVVTSKDSLSPLISYYENKNKITILTALIKACNKVRENPHHQRP